MFGLLSYTNSKRTFLVHRRVIQEVQEEIQSTTQERIKFTYHHCRKQTTKSSNSFISKPKYFVSKNLHSTGTRYIASKREQKKRNLIFVREIGHSFPLDFESLPRSDNLFVALSKDLVRISYTSVDLDLRNFKGLAYRRKRS